MYLLGCTNPPLKYYECSRKCRFEQIKELLKAQWSLYVPPVVTVCTAQWSLYVPPVVTICTAGLTVNNSTFCPYSVFVCFVWI